MDVITIPVPPSHFPVRISVLSTAQSFDATRQHIFLWVLTVHSHFCSHSVLSPHLDQDLN